MFDWKGLTLASALALLTASCAHRVEYRAPEPSTDTRQEPPPETVSVSGTTLLVNRPRELVWQRFVSGALRKGLVLKGPDKNAGELTIQFSGAPQPYVDCGQVISKVIKAGEEKTYAFPGAIAWQQYEIMNRGRVFPVERRMSLDATTRVVFKPLASGRTQVQAQSSYHVTRDQTVWTNREKPNLFTDSISFRTGDGAVFANAATRCVATGKLEAELLGLIRRTP